jgi:uncharacterized protein YqeY
MIIDTLKAVFLEKRKARDAESTSLLSTIIGEIETIAKTKGAAINDELVIATLKKFVKTTNDTLVAVGEAFPEVKTRLTHELALITSFLPVQVDGATLETRVGALVSSGINTMGDIMKALKSEFGGALDGKLASSIVKRLLQ